MTEIIFLVENEPEGGYMARAIGESIFTQADSIPELREMVKDAVECHYPDEATRPKPSMTRCRNSLNNRGKYMELRPIRTETDYQEALRAIELLFNAAPNSPECDRLDVLSTLVEAYEKKQIPIALPDDAIEAILYSMETRGLSRGDLELCLGSGDRVSEVLSRKRPLTLEMIRKLNQELGIPAEILIQPERSAKIPA